ncbi:bZIP transcription factor [Gigaspora margarita]|uniref:BZIP transcription factor n=1 Tax=Gigaspora margarita TaxID=4874 RepID=A0A8H3ZYH5_GIGMA|nr:bZIP transcription factor [Gigaspora margarita]
MSNSTADTTIEHKPSEVNESTNSIMEFLSNIKIDGMREEELDPEARSELIKEIVELQGGLKALIQKMETVKNEHDQMQSGNQILQTYINNLMSSNVLTSVNGGKKDG